MAKILVPVKRVPDYEIKAKVNREAVDASQKLKNEVDTLAGQIASKILGRDVA